MREEGVAAAVRFLGEQGLALPQEEFHKAYLDALAFAERKSSVEQEEHLATDTLVFLLQFYGYVNLPAELIRQAVDYTFAPDLSAYEVDSAAFEVLEGLRRREMKLGLLVNSQDEPAELRLIEKLGLLPYFHDIVISAGHEERWRKPRREAWLSFVEKWDMQPHELVMVGDDLVEDILGALNAQMWTIWLRRHSAGSELERAIHPDAIITDLVDVITVIDRWEQGG